MHLPNPHTSITWDRNYTWTKPIIKSWICRWAVIGWSSYSLMYACGNPIRLTGQARMPEHADGCWEILVMHICSHTIWKMILWDSIGKSGLVIFLWVDGISYNTPKYHDRWRIFKQMWAPLFFIFCERHIFWKLFKFFDAPRDCSAVQKTTNV